MSGRCCPCPSHWLPGQHWPSTFQQNLPIHALVLLFIIMTMGPTSVCTFPRFSPTNTNFVEAQLNDRAVLGCRVEGLTRQSTISWIRQSDLQILFVGGLKFTTDPRLEVIRNPRSGDFSLQINRIRKEDEGHYECQINTDPIKSMQVNLRVISQNKGEEKSVDQKVQYSSPNKGQQKSQPQEPSSGSSSEILGAPDIYFYPGALVNLTCLVNSPTEPGRIFWYHQGKVISYYSERGGVSVHRRSEDSTTIIASLLLREANEEDEGTYICRTENPNILSAHARLFIVYGSRSQASRSNAATKSSLVATIFLIALLVHLIE